MNSARKMLDEMRKNRTVEMEIVLQDFLDLTLAEQIEILFVGSVGAAQTADWCVAAITEITDPLGH